ncbi:YebG protein [Shigella boydii CDC 3083-94]|uniref:YebG protein n=2 Tax=Shigella boydii TaxID=621 RepID=B2U493_SHIB3|nr:YebG protein [Shigella boydii CDC 3083-94]ODG67826.1 hypothetical protein BFF42_11585 [Shigella sp. FC1661]ODJ22960.1 hypothetical protein BFR11_11230 [Shigella sp. FC2383]RCW04519.1 hypothetical protein A0U98_07980 [Shigella boydii]SPZ86535.1 YebG protein [Shigella boydii]
MAVEVKYVVIREGEEKMSFTSKKEAEQREALSLWLAEQKDVLSTILKTGKLPSPPTGRRC